MPVRVVDASALAAVLFNEPGGVAAAPCLTGVELIAPYLIVVELASVCLKKLRIHKSDRDHLLSQHALAEWMGVRYEPVRGSEVIALAEAENLTAYDASYLWMALEHDAGLVTLDERLGQAGTNLLHPDRVFPETR